MGSQAIQGQLWGKRPTDWATIQEYTGMAGYEYALHFLQLNAQDRLLDVGCGAGLFSDMAYARGTEVTGLDASAPLLAEARRRNSSIQFMVGEMEALPFPSEVFDVVCGFNSFQYAANVKNALTEAKRVLKQGGKLVAMIWGNPDECEAASFLAAVGRLLPPPPPGAPGPFALSENQLLETMLAELGLTLLDRQDVASTWDYQDTEVGLKGLMSTGPVARAIDHQGYETVYQTLAAAIQPYIQTNGHLVYHNKFRVVIAGK